MVQKEANMVANIDQHRKMPLVLIDCSRVQAGQYIDPKRPPARHREKEETGFSSLPSIPVLLFLLSSLPTS